MNIARSSRIPYPILKFKQGRYGKTWTKYDESYRFKAINGIINPEQSMNIQVANLTNKTILIHPQQHLAKVTRLNPAQVNMLYRGDVLAMNKLADLSENLEPDLSKADLTEERKSQLKELIESLSYIYNQRNGRTGLMKHKINLMPGLKPYNSPPYRYAPARHQTIKQTLKEILH